MNNSIGKTRPHGNNRSNTRGYYNVSVFNENDSLTKTSIYKQYKYA